MKKFFLFLISGGIILLLPWIFISFMTRGDIYTTLDTVPTKKYGLLLWTTPGINGGNLYFQTRIEATKELYEQKKIEHILVSGDNSDQSYNEPLYMRNALVKAGIPDKDITLDYAGFRTLDSILRAKEVFSLTDDFIIISQPFHLERALFIAKLNGINAVGYAAANVSPKFGFMPYIREIGARWLALYDIITKKGATVLGEKEPLPKFSSGEDNE